MGEFGGGSRVAVDGDADQMSIQVLSCGSLCLIAQCLLSPGGARAHPFSLREGTEPENGYKSFY